ncbi:KAP family NTPase [Methylomonas sp. MED-D]|uniref:KAP family NTPase n=1 Tax=Methylomonas sp. MED-D TaxID=3418768 RepID=UPI003D0473B3
MPKSQQTMRMPELLVFARVFTIWFVCAGGFRVFFYVGEKFAPTITDVDLIVRAIGIAVCLIICLIYAIMRDVWSYIVRLSRSFRFDIYAFAIIGVWSNYLTSSWLLKVQKFLDGANPWWAPTILVALVLVLLSPLFRTYVSLRRKSSPQFYFLGDDEIDTEEEDLLQIKVLAKDFADTVVASEAHSGLVFGIDGPWGAGKTSFINLAERHWEVVGNSVIVFRFEPLRYAAEPDLPERFLRDLTATIQRQIYAPEFRPAASRYSRMVKGLSLFGFRLSIEPLSETIDELLEAIDSVLKTIRMRVIVVIDDLDRLDAKTVNNVLFTIRRTFKLSQATYILCYDTENLVKGKDEGGNAREFFEKFVTVKLSLFVDSSTLRNFLLRDWKSNEHPFLTIPSDTMLKLESVLTELAEILKSDEATKYLPLIGDMRKLKRFVNAALMMQIEKTDFTKTDFNRRDLVNLMLLHLNYPGLFRRIYAEETEGRVGVYSAKRDVVERNVKFSNKEGFEKMISDNNDSTSQFLLRQLFDVSVLGVMNTDSTNESVLSSRACFNADEYRNLEKYLKLIVRFATPDRQETFVLYQDAVYRVKHGTSIAAILEEPEFLLQKNPFTQEKFWSVLINQSYDLTQAVAEEAIRTLVVYLPRYFLVYRGMWAHRRSAIYNLIYLLDRAGWGRTDGKRLNNTSENVVEIAERIYGEGYFSGRGLIQLLASNDRGVLGWNDLMLFRLHCSADMQSQTYNLRRALIVHNDKSAPTDGLLSLQALNGMRELSQRIFQHFKENYIEQSRNFLTDVDNTPDDAFFGDLENWLKAQDSESNESWQLSDQLLATRSAVKSFVLYQLANREYPNGSGAGCGLYDESGNSDAGGISLKMNRYIFGVCFNPDSDDNIFHFADYCLRSLSSSYFGAVHGKNGYAATETSLAAGLDPDEFKRYWTDFGQRIKEKNLPTEDRRVVTQNYVATYSGDLPYVFETLDRMVSVP